jgi:Tol biopolymer transport system component
MTDFKSAVTALSIMVLAASSLLSSSCSTGVNYKPSTLPNLITFSSDRDQTVHVYTIKPDGTDNRTTSADPTTFDGLPTWSPDGTKIAFTSNQSDDFEVWTMNEDGSNRIKLTNMRGWDGLIKWSPDGSKITFAGESPNPGGGSNMEVFIMNSDGSDVKKLTDSETWGPHSGDDDEPMRWNNCPTFSPDGTKILFASNRGGDYARPVIYTMNLDGSDQKKFGLFVDVDGTDADWSPVNNKIVFCRGTAAKGEIWVMDGSSPLPLLTAKKISNNIDNNHNPVWSPDGKQVAFVADTYGTDNIFIMNADGTSVRRVTYDKANDRHPSWR